MRMAFVLLVTGCGSTLVRVPGPEVGGPPHIERLMDLGGLPPPETGPLKADESDGHFMAGEWVLVRGSGLHDAKITLNGEPLVTRGYFSGGSVLVRLPSLPPRAINVIAAGDASTRFASELFVIGSDTDGNKLRFLRLGAGDAKKRVADPDLNVEQARPMFHTVSKDAALLYSLGIEGKRKEGKTPIFDVHVDVIHLGARGKPKKLATSKLEMRSHPTGIRISPAGVLVVLGNREVQTLSLENPLAPAPLGRLELSLDPTDRHLDMTFVKDAVALLEVGDNRVVLISLADPAAPTKTAELLLGPAEDLPFSIDLVDDPKDPEAFFVLQGLNLRVAGKKMSEGGDAVLGFVEKGWNMMIGKEDGEAPAVEAPDVPKRGRLVRVQANGALEKKETIEIAEDFVPLFVVVSGDDFFVSGVAAGTVPESLDASLDSAGRVLGFLKDSVQCGKIAKVSRDGKSENVVQGVSVFFDLDVLPNGALVYSGMRLSGRMTPPFVGVNWGIGLQGGHFFGLHKLGYDYFVPPYTYGQVSVQK